MTDVREKPVAWRYPKVSGGYVYASVADAFGLQGEPLYTRPADEALVCIGEVVELDDGIGTKIIDYTDARKDLSAGTKIYAPMQKEPGRE